MANWANPTLTSLYTNFVAEVTGRDTDLALGMDPAFTTVTNPPTNAIRWSSAAGKWQKWSGTAWGDLASAYAINITGTVSVPTGSQAAPSMSFASQPGTGFYFGGSQTIAMSFNGTAQAAFVGGKLSIMAGFTPVDQIAIKFGGVTVAETGVDRAYRFTDDTGATAYAAFGSNTTGGLKDAYINSAQAGGRILLQVAGFSNMIVGASDVLVGVPLVMQASQQLRLPLGSAAAPALANTDSGNNTGVFFGVNAVKIATAGTERLGVDSAGRLYGLALHNNSSLPSGTAQQYIASGNYSPTYTPTFFTPTITPLSNPKWIRVGNVVTVAGIVTVSVGAGSNTGFAFNISLPIPSAMTSYSDLGGSYVIGGAGGSQLYPAAQRLWGVVASGTAEINHVLYASITGPYTCNVHFTFTYEIK